MKRKGIGVIAILVAGMASAQWLNYPTLESRARRMVNRIWPRPRRERPTASPIFRESGNWSILLALPTAAAIMSAVRSF